MKSTKNTKLLSKTLKHIFNEAKEGLEEAFYEHRFEWETKNDRFDLGYIVALEDQMLFLERILKLLEKYEKDNKIQ